jgi:hypothetical protein
MKVSDLNSFFVETLLSANAKYGGQCQPLDTLADSGGRFGLV